VKVELNLLMQHYVDFRGDLWQLKFGVLGSVLGTGYQEQRPRGHGGYGKPLGHSGKNPFSTFTFANHTFAKLFVDSQIMIVHTILLVIQ